WGAADRDNPRSSSKNRCANTRRRPQDRVDAHAHDGPAPRRVPAPLPCFPSSPSPQGVPMHPINPAGLAAFDLETTGVDPTTARIVSASVVRLHGGQPAQRADWLADPGIEIPDSAAAVHGITTAHARAHGRPHDVVVAEIVDELPQSWALGYTVVVYNAAYDLRILATQHPGFTIDGPVFDPLVVDRAKVRYRPGKRTLEKVAAAYGVALSDAHDAYADAQAAGQIAH